MEHQDLSAAHSPSLSTVQSAETLEFIFAICALLFASWAINFCHTIKAEADYRRKDAQGQIAGSKKKKRSTLIKQASEQQRKLSWLKQSVIKNDDAKNTSPQIEDKNQSDEEVLSDFLKENSYFSHQSTQNANLSLLSKSYLNLHSKLYGTILEQAEQNQKLKLREIQRRRNFQVKKQPQKLSKKVVEQEQKKQKNKINVSFEPTKKESKQKNIFEKGSSLQKQEVPTFPNKQAPKNGIFNGFNLSKNQTSMPQGKAAGQKPEQEKNNLSAQTKQSSMPPPFFDTKKEINRVAGEQKISQEQQNLTEIQKEKQAYSKPESNIKEPQSFPKKEASPSNPQKNTQSKTQIIPSQKKELVEVQKTKRSVNSSYQYLQSIIECAESFDRETQIKTKINNFGGARSDSNEIWLFAKSYITSIDRENEKQVESFAHKVWDYVINRSIRATNIKDGFEKFPPKEKSSQAEKIQITTFIVIINLFRMLGLEKVWQGIFGKTLSFMKFLYERKSLIEGLDRKGKISEEKIFDNFDLMKNGYVTKQDDMSSKYLSRLDFLTFFLLGLTTLDPILFFQQIQEKIKDQFDFMRELKSLQFKWSYTQFWCLIDQVNLNKFNGYFKIPFWNNVLSLIYLQLLENRKNPGERTQFALIEAYCYKTIKSLVETVTKQPQNKLIMDLEFEKGNYEFDGDSFVNTIKNLGKTIYQKEKEMKGKNWEDFREKNSIVYYFWRSR